MAASFADGLIMMDSSALPDPGPEAVGAGDSGGEGAGTVVSVSGEGVPDGWPLLAGDDAPGDDADGDGDGPPPGEQAERPTTDTRTSA